MTETTHTQQTQHTQTHEHQQAGRGAWLWHLRQERSAFVVRKRAAAPEWTDAQAHQQTAAADPVLYALCAVDEHVGRAQRSRVLFTLLASSRKGLDRDDRAAIDRVVCWLLTVLPAAKVLEVFVALRKVRANHKHTAKAILRYLLNHPDMETLLKSRRPTVAEVFEHALGRDTFRGAVKHLLEGEQGDIGYARRHLLRWTEQVARTQKAIQAIFGTHIGTQIAPQDFVQISAQDPTAYERTHEAYEPTAISPAAPKTVTATNRGTIASHLVRLYRGGANAELEAAVERDVLARAATLPRFEGRVALVLDVSASAKSYGEREFCCVAQSVAFQKVLAKQCADLRVIQVGGDGFFSSLSLPNPAGPTDLATAVLDAVDTVPDVIIVVTDGYENRVEGDLGAVLEALPGAGVHVPVVMCHSLFTHKDDLSLRRPVSGWPELSFWHEDDFSAVISGLFSIAAGDAGRRFLRQTLTQRLTTLETAHPSWLRI